MAEGIQDDTKRVKQIEPSQPLPAKTTEQEDITKAGQRKINLIWEQTQAQIAKIAIWGWVISNFIVIIAMLFSLNEVNVTKLAVITAGLSSISLTVGIIIGFYFSRTNHSAIGGVGEKDRPSDKGTR